MRESTGISKAFQVLYEHNSYRDNKGKRVIIDLALETEIENLSKLVMKYIDELEEVKK